MSIGECLISPGAAPYVAIVDRAQHNNANSHVNSIWLLEYFGHFHAPSHHCPYSQNKLKKGCVQYSVLKEPSWGKIYKAPEIGGFSIKL